MDTDNSIIQVKAEDFYRDISDDVKNRHDTSNYEADKPSPKGMNKKAIALIKDELGEKIITGFDALKAKTYSYLSDDNKNVRKAEGTEKCVIKRILKFNDYKSYLFKNEIILKPQQRFKSEAPCIYKIALSNNDIALSSNDDRRLQTFDRITTYRYETNVKYVKVRCYVNIND